MMPAARDPAHPDDGGAAPSPAEIRRTLVRRKRVSFLLTGILFAISLSFVLACGFFKPFMASKVVAGLSVSMIYMLVVMVSATVLIGVYVYWADRNYDADWSAAMPRQRRTP